MIISEREELINQKNLSYTITPMVDMDEDSYFMSKDKIKRLCKTMLERIVLQFTINYDEKNENLEIEYFPSTTDFSMAKYNTKTFSIPEEILSILQGNMLLNIKEIENKAYYLLDIKNIMMRNFFFKNRFNLDQEDELQIIQTHKKIMKMSNLVYNNYSANMKTLKNISKLLYTQEKNIFLSMNQIPTKLVLCIDNILSLV